MWHIVFLVALAVPAFASDPAEVLPRTRPPLFPSHLPKDIRLYLLDHIARDPVEPLCFDHQALRSLELVNRATAQQIKEYRKLRQVLPRIAITLPAYAVLTRLMKGKSANWQFTHCRLNGEKIEETNLAYLLDRSYYDQKIMWIKLVQKDTSRFFLFVYLKGQLARRSTRHKKWRPYEIRYCHPILLDQRQLMMETMIPKPNVIGELNKKHAPFECEDGLPISPHRPFQVFIDQMKTAQPGEIYIPTLVYPRVPECPSPFMWYDHEQQHLHITTPSIVQLVEMLKGPYANPIQQHLMSPQGWCIECWDTEANSIEEHRIIEKHLIKKDELQKRIANWTDYRVERIDFDLCAYRGGFSWEVKYAFSSPLSNTISQIDIIKWEQHLTFPENKLYRFVNAQDEFIYQGNIDGTHYIIHINQKPAMDKSYSFPVRLM